MKGWSREDRRGSDEEFFFSGRRGHTRSGLGTGVQTGDLPISSSGGGNGALPPPVQNGGDRKSVRVG